VDGRFGAGDIVRERERYRKEPSDAFPFQSLTHMSSPFQGGLGLGRMGASTPFALSGLDPNDKKAGLYAHFVPAGATGHHHFDPASGESTSGIPASEAKGETAKAKKQKKKKKKKKDGADELTNDAAAEKPKKRRHSTEGATETENPQKRKKTEGGVAVVELEPDSSIADERKKKKKKKKKQEDENKLEETTSCNADGVSKKKEEEEKKEKKEKKEKRETETPIAVMADDVAQKLAKCKKRIAKTSDEAELSRLRIKLAKLETKARS